ncbi:hypothetical protein XELAEV_18031680mg [Xenopus laevis]|uniref:SRCR domain-containing protein n=1 Tax=Xenopus laevis TaxID=8355 RepID=A0A974CN74_XENLA|nr:hypothetical protein XELAEV_18031680mg [Xenopus laevis]
MHFIWSLKYLILGNLWYLVDNREVQTVQPNMTMVCYQDAKLLCALHGNHTFMCTNMSQCLSLSRPHNNTNREDNSVRKVQCDIWFNNCTVTDSGMHLCLLGKASEEHRNINVSVTLTDCSAEKKNSKGMCYIPDIVFYFIIFLSLLIMYLSYLCSREVMNESPTHSHRLIKNLFLNGRELQPEKIEDV